MLIGEGEERRSLEMLANNLKIKERTLFMGWKENARAHLEHFDVFVLPSNNEAFPLTIVEAMLAKVPVIATDVGSVNEAIVDRFSGILISNNEPDTISRAIEDLMTNEGLRKQVVKNGFTKASTEFTESTMISKYETMWHKVRGKVLLH